MYRMDRRRHEIGWIKRHPKIDNLLGIIVVILCLTIMIYTAIVEWSFERMPLDELLF